MSERHILHLLEERTLTSLSAAELERIATHTETCVRCAEAYEAAQLAFAMLQEWAAVTVEPSPFFQTRVMVALREQRQAKESLGVGKLWQTAKLLLASMAVFVVLLASLTIYNANTAVPELDDSPRIFASTLADVVLAAQDNFDEAAITNTQALSDLYEIELEESNGK